MLHNPSALGNPLLFCKQPSVICEKHQTDAKLVFSPRGREQVRVQYLPWDFRLLPKQIGMRVIPTTLEKGQVKRSEISVSC